MFQFLIGPSRVGRTIGTRTSTRRPPRTTPSVIVLPMRTSEIRRYTAVARKPRGRHATRVNYPSPSIPFWAIFEDLHESQTFPGNRVRRDAVARRRGRTLCQRPHRARGQLEASGPGSFAQAILDANNDPTITRIQFTGRVTTVSLSGTVVYTGPQPLTIEGNNAIIDGTNANAAAIVANGGGDLTVRHLTVRGAPGEGIERRSARRGHRHDPRDPVSCRDRQQRRTWRARQRPGRSVRAGAASPSGLGRLRCGGACEGACEPFHPQRLYRERSRRPAGE